MKPNKLKELIDYVSICYMFEALYKEIIEEHNNNILNKVKYTELNNKINESDIDLLIKKFKDITYEMNFNLIDRINKILKDLENGN